MRSPQIVCALFAAFLLVLLATADVSAQLDTVWQFPGVPWVAPDGCGGAFVASSGQGNAIARVDSTGTVLWSQVYLPPAWPWQSPAPLKTILDYSKSVIGVWLVGRVWDDPPGIGHSQLGCAVWKYDSLGVFQWVVYTQLPDSVSFSPQAVFVSLSNEITILGGYVFASGWSCEPLHKTAMGIMRVSSGGTMSFNFQCDQVGGGQYHWPEDPRQSMTFSADFDEESTDSCQNQAGVWSRDYSFYVHTLYRYANGSIQQLELHLKGTHTPVIDEQHLGACAFDYNEYRSVARIPDGVNIYLECDSSGNTFELITELKYEAIPQLHSCRRFLAKYTTGGGLDWMTVLSPWYAGYDHQSWPPMDVVADHEGSAIVACPDGFRKYSSAGTLQWYVPTPSDIADSTRYVRMAVDTRNNVYAQIWAAPTYGYLRSWFLCLGGKTGKQRYVYNLWGANVTSSSMTIDSVGCIYGSFAGGIQKFRQNMSFVIRDAHGDRLPDEEFTLIRVSDDPPLFTEDTLGMFTTDNDGVYRFPMIVPDSFEFKESILDVDPDTLGIDELFKVAKRVYDAPSVRHPGLVGTQYSVHLDNLHVDADGAIAFDTIDGEHHKDVILGHTEYRYNLLVSAEWDAVEAYQQGLQEDFRQMSNYLYDVTDGQLRLDTVAIVDDGELWDMADVRIRANNVHGPDAVVNAINRAGWYPITMPRKWYGDFDPGRWYSYEDHPLDMSVSEDYRAKAHEFGHFALGFYDEYCFCDQTGKCSDKPDLHCQPYPIGNYGFMDHEYDDETGGVRASEMSSRYRYVFDACRNTEQITKNDTSCWDQFEEWAEGTFDGIYVPIRRPDQSDTLEHLTPTIVDYIRGPNDNLAAPDYDVGQQIYFASPIQPPDPATRSLNLHVSGVPAGGVDVTLRRNIVGGYVRTIEQGKTRDDGLIWVLGGSPADVILTSGHSYVIINQSLAAAASQINRQWLTASLEMSTVVGDSASITLQPIEGDYPLVLTADVGITPQRWRLEFLQPFSQLPSMEFQSQSGQPMMPSVIQLSDNYNVRPDDSIASEGQARLDAVDGAGHPFFVPFSYITYDHTDSTQLNKLLGPGAHAILSLSSDNNTITKALITASSYPPILTGLEADAVQAGDAYATSVSPSVTLTGANNLTILYSDDDLKASDSLIGDETLLKMYRWHEGYNSWEYIGGQVDTSGNSLTAEISALGTYALFTTKSPVGVEDEPEDELPYRFELSQNYPNPFNPTTIIEYSLPTRTQVTIEIFNVLGQKVRTLVNETKSAGSYRIEWRGTDDAGRPVSTGVYLYRFATGEVVQTKKMLLLK